jgi:hypothetical protein
MTSLPPPLLKVKVAFELGGHPMEAVSFSPVKTEPAVESNGDEYHYCR